MKNSSPKTPRTPTTPSSKIRLNKWLAEQGFASRRAIDQWIVQGRIMVDGQVVTELGLKIDPQKNKISVDEKPVVGKAIVQKKYFAFYKPKNVITSLKDPEGRPCIGDYIKHLPYRLFPVGRLDYDAEGLIILSNDGELTHRMMHPKFGHQRIYQTKVKGFPTKATLTKLSQGIELDDGFANFERIVFMVNSQNNSWYEVMLKLGRYHIVKRLWEAVGHPVLKLIRIQYGEIKSGDLQPGELRPLTPKEIDSCR